MSETNEEKLNRLQMMVETDEWDLSDNDRAAIAYVLDRVLGIPPLKSPVIPVPPSSGVEAPASGPTFDIEYWLHELSACMVNTERCEKMDIQMYRKEARDAWEKIVAEFQRLKEKAGEK